jgi:REP element-mobilizing transposase RayT
VPQSLACLNVHIVFSTKGRMPLIGPDWSDRLYGYLGGTIQESRSVLLCAGGMPDHVHLLVSMGREPGVAELVRLMKSNSSKWVHETFPGLDSFAWQAGYGAFSVSYSQVGRVKQYIQDQAEHHRTTSFQDEYRALLRRHGIEWDERYVWD